MFQAGFYYSKMSPLKFKSRQIASTLIIIICLETEIRSLPINNGFTIKFNSVPVKEDTPKSFSALFARIPQEPSPKLSNQILSEEKFPKSVDLATGCSNQIAKILFPTSGSYGGFNDTQLFNQVNFINVPVMMHGASEYKILVVSAPHKVKLGKDAAKPMLVYIVFPSNDSNDAVNIPSIYFVNKSDGKLDLKAREKVDPIFIIDNNRTVTGLKSKEVSKFIKFKSKFTNHLNVEAGHLRV